MSDPINRFSGRARNYADYRPSYPTELLDLLSQEAQFTDQDVVADIGAGTGKLTKLFLENGNKVFAIEPNDEMRAVCIELLSSYTNLTILAGRAEDSTLPSKSVDLIVVGQALHWFDATAARHEFKRILRSHGFIMLVWNDWYEIDSPLQRDYSQLVRLYANDFNENNHTRASTLDTIARFYGSRQFVEHHMANVQIFDFEGLLGRTLSSSYMPTEGQAGFEPLLRDLGQLFLKLEREGLVTFHYDTVCFIGQLSM